jgi:hypothetical protein
MLCLWWWKQIIDERPYNAKANIQAYNTQANNDDIVQAHYPQAYLEFRRISQTNYTKADVQANSNDHGSTHHGSTHHGLSHHGSTHHGLSHHGSTHHGFSHHGFSHHRIAHHGLSHHRITHDGVSYHS